MDERKGSGGVSEVKVVRGKSGWAQVASGWSRVESGSILGRLGFHSGKILAPFWV